jgi:SnoaL-like domain
MTTTTSTTADIADRWTRFWNGELALAADLLDPDFRIHLGTSVDPGVADAVRGPAGMAAFVDRYRESHGDVRFRVDGPPAGERERTAFLWSAALPDGRRVSGIDLAALAGDRIREVWSVTGARLLPEVPAA